MRIALARRALGVAAVCVLARAAPLAAQSAGTDAIPWAFAPLLGTGRYEIADGAVVQSIGYAPRRRLREAALASDASERRIGIELRVPLSVTTYQTDLSELSSIGFDDFGTFAAVPGVEFDVPLSERLSIKPLAYAGAGKEFHGGPTAAIYWAGLKTRLSFTPGELGLDLVTSLRYAGFETSDDESGDIVPLRAGVEFTKPMRDKELGGDALNWYWHVAHTHYLDDDVGRASDPAPLSVDDEWELGVAFGKRDERLRLGWLGWDRVGFALTVDSDADLTGFRLVFRSLYDR